MSEHDIVKRLRAPESWRSFPDPDDDAPTEAAAEIERLRAERDAALRRAERSEAAIAELERMELAEDAKLAETIEKWLTGLMHNCCTTAQPSSTKSEG